MGFSAVLGHEYCDNFMFPRFQVCQSHPVAIIEAGPSNVISGTDWLLEATTDPETLSKDPKWAFWPVAISKPKTLRKLIFVTYSAYENRFTFWLTLYTQKEVQTSPH